MKAVAPRQLDALARLLHERVGLYVRPEGWGTLRLAVAARLGPDADEAAVARWLEALRESEEELRQLLPLVTVGKTSFFRDERQFAALGELLPGWLAAARLGGRKLSIWSAGCATGEEVWSLAVAALEAGAEPPELELLGTDVNPVAVAAAEAGRFAPSRLEGLPQGLLDRYFHTAPAGVEPLPHLRRAAARFAVHNLADERYPLPAAGSWDAVFCRNVLIYFDLATTLRVLERMHRALRPGGFLFLGYSESLFRIFDGFELVERAGSFFYRKPETQRPRAPAPEPMAHPPMLQPPAPQPIPPAPTPPLLSIGEAIEAGNFEQARAELERRLATCPDDLGARLTLGNLYVLLRLPEQAAACYEAALELEPLRAEAHLLLGIHLLAQGQLERAAAELGRALFLEPELGLGHYFLGRCREKLADLDGARRCYRNALRSFRETKGAPRFLGFYPDLPADGGAFVRAAEGALQAL